MSDRARDRTRASPIAELEPPLGPYAGTHPIRLATWPAKVDEFPYFRAFYGALAPHGVVPFCGFSPDERWLSEHKETIDCVHVHWPDGLWRKGNRTFQTRLRGVLKLRRFWRLLADANIPVVWTAHNLERHEGADWLDRAAYRTLVSTSRLVICHSEHVAGQLRMGYRREAPIVVMPICSFHDLYPAPRPREMVLRELGLRPDLPVVSCLGHIRPYKGVDVACDAASQLNGRVQMIVGGKPYENWIDIATLQRRLATAGNSVFIDRRVTDQELADITAASDAVLLPYRHTYGSAALLTAWTLERGVIASDLPYFREMVKPAPEAARLYETGNVDALARAIEGYLAVPATVRSNAARRLAAYYSWQEFIPPVAARLQELIDSKRPS